MVFAARVFSCLIVAGTCAACTITVVNDENDPGKVSRYLVPLSECAPSISQDMRYAGANNFTGRPVDGYLAPVCMLTPPAARALARAQADAATYDLTLRVYDCYRPQRAVNRFLRWAGDVDDQGTKSRFYPAVDKTQLFGQGYIAARSSHSRGSTVDITLAPAGQDGIESLEMGTPFDYFDPLAHTANADIPPQARHNRLLLKLLMEKHGFENYAQEWWHYTLQNEPWPDSYLDFPVEPVAEPGTRSGDRLPCG